MEIMPTINIPEFPTSKSSVREWAKWFAYTYDMRVFPVTTTDRGDYKKPYKKGWKEEASTNVSNFDPYWDTEACKGYGVVLDNHTVIDIDNMSDEAMTDIQDKFGDWPSTLTVRSGRNGGGEHRYFFGLSNTYRKKNPNFDFMTNGFVVGPGSYHSTGRRYELILGTLSMAEVPDAAVLVPPDTEDNSKFISNLPHLDCREVYEALGGKTKIDYNLSLIHI